MKKKTFLVGLALFLSLGLVACGNDDATETEAPAVTEDAEASDVEVAPTEDSDTDEVVEGPGHATSAGGITTEDALIDALGAESSDRAWVAGLASDIEMDGPLYIEGDVQRHSAGEFTTTDSGEPVFARKLGFYIREAELNGAQRVPTGAWSLTVRNGIIVNSPNTFFISDGPFIADVFGDVYVNVPYFRLSGVRIHGDIIFANEHYRDTAVFQVWDSEAAEIQDAEDADYSTEFVLYRSNTGFETNAPLSSSDATANVSNADASDLVTGEIRIAE